MIAHAQKAADTNNDVVDLGGLVDDQLLDLTDLVVVFVVHVDTDHLGSSPLSVPVDGRIDVRAVGGGALSKGHAGQERGAQHRGGHVFRFHLSLQVVGCWLEAHKLEQRQSSTEETYEGGNGSSPLTFSL